MIRQCMIFLATLLSVGAPAQPSIQLVQREKKEGNRAALLAQETKKAEVPNGSKSAKYSNSLTPTWSVNQEKQHLKYRQVPNTWAWDLLKRDLDDNSKGGSTTPIRFGAFPVPKYELLGKESFKGIGAAGNLSGIAYDGKTIVYAHFYAKKNAINKPFIGDKPDEVFFTIVVLTDFVDAVNFTHVSVHMISRNNPDYIAGGFFKTKKDEIDFTAFITASRDEFAIVNMRLFNLKYGRTILIAPQKDGSLRSMQLTSPILSAMEIKNYIDKILKEQDVNKFFTNKENI